MTWSRREFVGFGVGALTVRLLPACNAPTEPSRIRFTARPGMPTLAPVPGLSPLGLGGSRDGLLYVPTTHSPVVPLPLFVGLHGSGGDSDDWVSYPGRAEAGGFVFLAPDSRDGTWDLISRGTVGPDVSFIDRALAHTFARCRIDPERVCFAGFSDGASYGLSLGLANGDLFSHLVAYSPGFLAMPEAPVGKPRIFVSHGLNDLVLPVRLSRNEIVPDLQEAGYDTTFRQFDGGHEVPGEISTEALAWFLA